MRNLWKVLPVESNRCYQQGTSSADLDCPAHPSNPKLWNSSLTRADENYKERLLSWRGKYFWVGVVLTPEYLSKAVQQGANQLILGRFNAAYQVFIDGQYYADGEGRGESQPLVIPFSMERLSSSKPIHIAIQVHHNLGHYFPDLLNSVAGGEGLTTRRSATIYFSLMSFWNISRPFAFTVAYSLMALVFLYIWITSPKEQEYFYIALHLMVASFMQMRIIDTLDINKSLGLHYGLGFILEFYKSCIGLFLGLSFARSRLNIFKFGLPAMVVAPLLVFPFLHGPIEIYDAYAATRKHLGPPLHFLGGLVCFIQAIYLQLQSKEGSYLPVRIRRLWLFGSGLVILAVLYFFYTQSLVVAPKANQLLSLWLGAEHFILIIYLGLIASSEITHQGRLIHKTPMSIYHQMSPMPEVISGYLLVIDLKQSEIYYRSRASTGQSLNLVGVWRSHIYSCANRFNGTIVNKKGDEVAILFEKNDSAKANIYLAFEEMVKSSRIVEQQFREQGLMPEGATGFKFRAALGKVSMRPTWENMGEIRVPAWQEKEGTQGIESIEKLLKAEKKFDPKGQEVLLICDQTLISSGEIKIPTSPLAKKPEPSITGSDNSELNWYIYKVRHPGQEAA